MVLCTCRVFFWFTTIFNMCCFSSCVVDMHFHYVRSYAHFRNVSHAIYMWCRCVCYSTNRCTVPIVCFVSTMVFYDVFALLTFSQWMRNTFVGFIYCRAFGVEFWKKRRIHISFSKPKVFAFEDIRQTLFFSCLTNKLLVWLSFTLIQVQRILRLSWAIMKLWRGNLRLLFPSVELCHHHTAYNCTTSSSCRRCHRFLTPLRRNNWIGLFDNFTNVKTCCQTIRQILICVLVTVLQFGLRWSAWARSCVIVRGRSARIRCVCVRARVCACACSDDFRLQPDTS